MLLTNGCSFVWGDELEGYDQDPPVHHPLTFAHQLAEKLNVDYINLAQCGSCNQKIFRDTTDYLRTCEKLPSHIVILWSAWQREEIAENYPVNHEKDKNIFRSQCMTQISPSRTNQVKPELFEIMDSYYDHYDVTRTGIIRTFNYMTHMQWLCETLGIKLIQGVFHRRMWENVLLCMDPRYRKTESPWSEWMDYLEDSLNYLKDTSRVGMNRYIDLYSLSKEKYTIKPHAHPDEDANSEYADILYNIFLVRFEYG